MRPTIRTSTFSLTRRRLIAGALAAASGAVTRTAVPAGNTAAEDSVRILRASPRGSPPPGGKATPAGAIGWSYDGMIPGPILHARRGEEFRLRLVNDLPVPTALHWHGVRLANAMDGAPPLTQQPVAPGSSFEYRFTPPDAGTFWYHPPDRTARGLYGLLIVDEAEVRDAAAGDIPMMLDSTIPNPWTSAPDRSGSGGRAERLTVNGLPFLDIPVIANTRQRLRLLNASADRMLTLRVTRLRSFVMAIDGQPAERFAPRDGRILLGPGNRCDLFVDCNLAPGEAAPIVVDDTTGTVSIAHIVGTSGPPAAPAAPDPPPLPANPLPQKMDLAAAFRFEATLERIGEIPANLPPGLGKSPLFRAKAGRTIVLTISNPTLETHYIHLHGHSFRLLDALDDGWKPFWLDTMPLAPQDKVRIAFVADNPGKWLVEGFTRGGATAWFEVD